MSAIFIGVIASVFILLFYIKGANIFQTEAEAALNKKLASVDNLSNYTIYTTGHPYVWVASSKEEMFQAVKESCSGYQGMPQPARYKMVISPEKQSIYYAANGLTKPTFGDLMHYDEWLESKKPLQENIAQYKKKQKG